VDYFGFALDVYSKAPTGYCWWLHSFVLLPDGTLLNPYPFIGPAFFYAIPWSRTLLNAVGTVDDHPFRPLLTKAQWISDGELFGTGWALVERNERGSGPGLTWLLPKSNQ
jgi:hypothetical protein